MSSLWVIIAVVCIFITVGLWTWAEMLIDKKWNKSPMHNFEFVWHKNKLWYSRSVVCCIGVFAKDKDGKWYVLANKRCSGAALFKDKWNLPCGYLDFGESGEQCVLESTLDDTGVKVPQNGVKLSYVSTNPKNHRENVNIVYMSVLSKTIDKYPTVDPEDSDICEAKWVSIDEYDKLKWIFSHNKAIKKMYEKIEG